MVDEPGVLRRIQHFEHSRRGVARVAPVGHLVDLVDHDDGVTHLHATECLNEQSGHGAHIRPTVSANFRLIAHPTHGDAIELAADGGGNRFAE